MPVHPSPFAFPAALIIHYSLLLSNFLLQGVPLASFEKVEHSFSLH